MMALLLVQALDLFAREPWQKIPWRTELLDRIHDHCPGSHVVFEADGSIVLQTTLTARRAWMDWWEKRQ